MLNDDSRELVNALIDEIFLLGLLVDMISAGSGNPADCADRCAVTVQRCRSLVARLQFAGDDPVVLQ